MKRREHLVGNLRSAAPALPSMLASEWLASIWRSTEMSALRGRAGPELAARAIIFRVRREALSDFHVDCLAQSIAIHVCAQFAVATCIVQTAEAAQPIITSSAAVAVREGFVVPAAPALRSVSRSEAGERRQSRRPHICHLGPPLRFTAFLL